MKILIPKLEINEETGFERNIDIFGRADFGERLANLIEKSSDNPVIALDSGWGEGKSIFIQMWRGYLSHHREEKIKSIYFDAFENDYQKDPFMTLASEIYQLIEPSDEESKKEFREQASNAIKSFARGAIKIGVKAATAGVLDGGVLDSVEKEVSNLAADQLDNLIKDKFANSEKDKLALKHFREYLEKFAIEQGDGKPIVFIIDELDRCKPDFALELLEQIKHLFSVNNITFLLVTNRKQIEETIKAKYGKDIDPTNYLHKFIHLWLAMPRLSSEYDDHGSVFLKYAIKSMCSNDERIHNQESLQVFNQIIRYYQPSYREIERMLSYFAIIHNMSGDTQFLAHYQYMLAFVCFLKACRPEAFDNKTGGGDYSKIIKISDLENAEEDSEFCLLHYIKKLIKFDLAPQEIKNQMMQNKEIHFDHHRMPTGLIKTISGWLSEIKRSR